ncbi:MAG: tRNA (N(6)-L-threonylcarbamoyladenosine(37)-C(2))-methylthiotransferase MtaB [Lachnospiraceae bacterium]
MKKVAFHNLGCKVNAYELDAMQKLFLEQGYEPVSFEEKADVYVINTCTVTNIADRKSRQMLHRAKKMNPDALVVAVGCYVNSHAGEIISDNSIDLCIGNNQKGKIAELVTELLSNRKVEIADTVQEPCAGEKMPDINVPDISKENEYEELEISTTAERCRAFIKVQDGCNQFCSYCIIPYARGRARSRKKEHILKEIGNMVAKGYQEFVITGIHLSSYGTDFTQEKPKADCFGPSQLLDLLWAISRIPGVTRIRLGSLEPRLITEEFARELAKIPQICPHFHLSLQSGCDRTLQRMNRHYTAQEYKEKTEILRREFVHPAITTDIIVGFPGETEEDFEQCRCFAEEVSFYEMHIFKYSRRKGTPADRMTGQLTDAEKTKRSHILEELEYRQSQTFRSYYLGRQVEVLIEEKKELIWENEKKICWIGHTPEYIRVAVPVENDATNHADATTGNAGNYADAVTANAGNLVNCICRVMVDEVSGEQYLQGHFI